MLQSAETVMPFKQQVRRDSQSIITKSQRNTRYVFQENYNRDSAILANMSATEISQERDPSLDNNSINIHDQEGASDEATPAGKKLAIKFRDRTRKGNTGASQRRKSGSYFFKQSLE